MRLNKSQRAGVVLSVLWMFCAAIYLRINQMNAAQLLIDTAYLRCIEKNEWDFAICLTKAQFQYEDAISISQIALIDIFIAMVLPPLVAWLLFLVFIKVYRWVMAG